MDATEYQKAASAAIKLRQIRGKYQRTVDRLAKAGNRHDDYMVASGQVRALDFAIAFLETHAAKACNYTEGSYRCVLSRGHGDRVAHVLRLGGES